MRELAAFKRPALQFSGGKDSLACLYLLRSLVEQGLAVYWVNTGDGCPETRGVIEHVRSWVPNFIEIRSDVKAWRQQHGNPVDLLPASNTMLGVAYGMSDVRLSGRFDCCQANLMLPLHNRMVEDGVDCVIRGTKLVDAGRVPAEGATPWYHIVLPLRDWSHQEVFDYLNRVKAPANPIYQHFKAISAPECMSCTAWWDDGKMAYLKARHPQLVQEHRIKLETVRAQLQEHLRNLDDELKEG